MATKMIRIEEIPLEQNARQFLDSLDVAHGEVVLEQNGKPRLAFVPVSVVELLEQRRQAKEQLFTTIEHIRERNRGVDSDNLLEELEALDHPERSPA